jgi:hypothetical protein
MVTPKVPGGEDDSLSSAGHRLGQIIGDWWETKVIYPLLLSTAKELNLFLDNRIISRDCRAEKVQWMDVGGNIVDYDYVLEIGGSLREQGVPVAFLESFWRRGARHSKDKARDDTNKLLPMRRSYPTARFLAIAACGEFTEPAREYVRSNHVELFFISKENIVAAFHACGIQVDYPDSFPEEKKQVLVRALERKFDDAVKMTAAETLRKIAGAAAFDGFRQRIVASLSALPQEIRIFMLKRSAPAVFYDIAQATKFLASKAPSFAVAEGAEQYEYQVVFSDGSEFGRSLNSLDKVRETNAQVAILVNHMKRIGMARNS